MTNRFLIRTLFLYLPINAYIFIRGWQAMPSILIYKLIFTVIFLCLASLFFVAMTGRNKLPLRFLKIIYPIGTTWMAFTMYFFLFFLVTDIIGLFNRRIDFLPEIINLHFRQIQVYGSTVAIAVLLIFGYRKFTHPSINTLNVKINKKAGARRKLRVIEISDIHLGLSIDKKRFSKYVDKINVLQSDIILIAGDLIDNSVRLLNAEHIEAEINRMQAPLGIYMCPGNHDYRGGIDECSAFLKKTKINLLIDNAAYIDNSFWIIGRKDRSLRLRKSVKNLIAECAQSNPIFLLDHQPFHLEEAEEAGIDFQLSGHTHNGQIFPGNLIVNKIYEVGYGYKRKKNLHVYVSSGLGIWGPLFRIGTESEIAVFDIQFD